MVGNAIDVTFLWALGITDRLELGLAVPVTFWQEGDGRARAAGAAEELPTTALRDARFGLALSLLQRPRLAGAGGPALTARMAFGVPVGDDRAFAGAESATAIPSLAVDWRFGKLLLAADLGARIREESEIGGAVVGTQLSAALGATYDILPDRWLSAGAEVFALWGLSEQAAPVRDQASLDSGPPAVPTEFIVSASSAHFLGGDLVFALGGGGGIPLASEPAITAPRFRFDLAVKYAPSGRDSDGDGILDRDDRCPAAAEDKDGFQDEDGCPEEDNDEDGIADASDRCRDAAETIDGHDDEDGCPDDDDDGDGVNDDTDRCRNDTEDRDGFQDGDGCPDPDNDSDGIPDAADRCPSGPEDKDGFKDDDGCPDPDNDLDGLADAADRCPDGAEDKDGFEDDDGCPDPDNDEDGVLDAADVCPTAAETLDGNRDEDGCPEPGARSLVRWNGARVETEQPLRFPAGSATIGGALQKQVAMVVQLVRSRGAEQVIVEGFPDRLGDTSTRAQGLADQRAQAMKAAFVAAGVPEARIIAAVGERPTGSIQASVEITVVAERPKKP
ncbi:MAG: OmpA family protein [Polyangiaceae bacterium]